MKDLGIPNFPTLGIPKKWNVSRKYSLKSSSAQMYRNYIFKKSVGYGFRPSYAKNFA